MSQCCNARRRAPGLLLAIGIQACTSAPQEPDAPDTAASPAEAEVAATHSTAPENPYPGMTMRTGPNGARIFCHKEVATGERIAKERCYTEHAMRQMKQDKRQEFEKSRETSAYGTGGV